MKDSNQEQWKQLCAEAATEQDRERLMKMVAEIVRLLDEKEQQLKAPWGTKAGAG